MSEPAGASSKSNSVSGGGGMGAASKFTTLEEKHRRKILMGTTALTGLGLLFLIIAISTDHWMRWEQAKPLNLTNKGGPYLLSSYRGLWRICRVVYINSTSSTPTTAEMCYRRDQLFNDHQTNKDRVQNNDAKGQGKDPAAKDYTRTEAAFGIISLALSVISHLFALYTFKETRYMFKRLAGSLYLCAAACMLVCVEVLSNHVEEESVLYKASSHSYGFSLVIMWMSLVFHAAAGIIFIILGRKHKLDHLNVDCTDQNPEDEPMHLGRV